MQRDPVIGPCLTLFRATSLGDAIQNRRQRRVEVDQQSWGAGGGRVKELTVQASIELPLRFGHVSLLVQPAREHLGVLVPCAVQNPSAAEAPHAAHRGEAGREEMQLQMQRVRAHSFRLAIEVLEPGIVTVHTLETELETETRSEGA